MIDELIEAVEKLNMSDGDLEQINLQNQTLRQIKLLNERVEEAFETTITIGDIDE